MVLRLPTYLNQLDSIDSAVSTIAKVPPLEQISCAEKNVSSCGCMIFIHNISHQSVISHQPSIIDIINIMIIFIVMYQSESCNAICSVLFYLTSFSVSVSVPISSFHLLLSYLSFYLNFVFIVTYFSAQDFFNC